MAEPDWIQAIERWRKLPEAEKHATRWRLIPRSVAASMAFEGEPVDLAMLEAEHARQPVPLVSSKPPSDP
jgi:hypothetical protein